MLCTATYASANNASKFTFSNVETEQATLVAAVNILDHYMLAGTESDAERGAKLLAAFEVNSRKAIYDTRRIYKKQHDLLSAYRSISSDLYGYEIKKGLLGSSIHLEGGIETEFGISGEFKATLTYRHKRWVISQIAIN